MLLRHRNMSLRAALPLFVILLASSGCAAPGPIVETTAMFLSACPAIDQARFRVEVDRSTALVSAELQSNQWQFVRFVTRLGVKPVAASEFASGANLSSHVALTRDAPVLNVQLVCSPEPVLEVFPANAGWTNPRARWDA
jgi:hypothetical protein